MKNILIVMAASVIAAVASVVIIKTIGYEPPPWLGGAIGGAVSAAVAVKLAEKNSAE